MEVYSWTPKHSPTSILILILKIHIGNIQPRITAITSNISNTQ